MFKQKHKDELEVQEVIEVINNYPDDNENVIYSRELKQYLIKSISLAAMDRCYPVIVLGHYPNKKTRLYTQNLIEYLKYSHLVFEHLYLQNSKRINLPLKYTQVYLLKGYYISKQTEEDYLPCISKKDIKCRQVL